LVSNTDINSLFCIQENIRSHDSDVTGIGDDEYDGSWLHRNDQYDPTGTNVETRLDDECVT
jgi:hypothetical protein